MADLVTGGIKRATGWSIVIAILMILAGVIAIIAPLQAGLVVVLVVGWTAVFNGIAHMVYAFGVHQGQRSWLEALLGVVYIIAGIYLVLHPAGGLLALTLLLGSFLLVYGIFALVLAFRMRPHSGWTWVLFDAVITILLGVLIYAHWPFTSEWAIGTLFGVSFISSGISRLMVSLALRRITARTV